MFISDTMLVDRPFLAPIIVISFCFFFLYRKASVEKENLAFNFSAFFRSNLPRWYIHVRISYNKRPKKECRRTQIFLQLARLPTSTSARLQKSRFVKCKRVNKNRYKSVNECRRLRTNCTPRRRDTAREIKYYTITFIYPLRRVSIIVQLIPLAVSQQSHECTNNTASKHVSIVK